ncbi:MAG: putative prokaryotic signal transducing protein, partial [Pseudomonadota bacterium]
MQAIYYAESLLDARLLVDRLDDLGIRTFLHNEHLQGALGELPMTLRPVVSLVDERDWGRARDAVIQFEAARCSPETPDRPCP